MDEIIKDDLLFKPYKYGGYQCKIETKRGTLSIRFGSDTLFCKTGYEGFYEVRYPDGEVVGNVTSDEIYDYILREGVLLEKK